MNCSRVRTSFSLTYFKGCYESKYASSSSIFSFSCAALANFAFWLKWSWCNFSILGLTLTVARAPCPFLSFVAFDYEILKNKIRKGRSKKTYFVINFVKSRSVTEHFVDFILFPVVLLGVCLYASVMFRVIIRSTRCILSWWNFLSAKCSINSRADWSRCLSANWVNVLDNG